jgi:NTP pyrophosphatase (non-canonical NTP hydrolase)
MNKFRRTLSTDKDVQLHMAIGLSTETGELLDAYKKSIFYGRELNIQNVKEEIGDIVWYLEILMDEIGYSYEEAKEDVIQKLAKRYPEKFEDVLIRDVNNELSHIGSTGP